MCEAASKRFQRTQGLPRGADWCTLIIEEPVSMKLLHQVKLPLELQRDFRLFDIFFSILQINCMLVLSCTSIQKPTPLIYCTVSFSPGWGETHCSYFAHHAFTLHTNQSSFVFSMSFGHEIKSGVCMHSCIDIHTHTHTLYSSFFMTVWSATVLRPESFCCAGGEMPFEVCRIPKATRISPTVYLRCLTCHVLASEIPRDAWYE